MAARVALLLFALAVLASVRTGTTSAHANLVRSEPEANALLAQSPFEIKLYFSEQPELGSSRINVLDPSGARLDNDDLHQHGDKTVLSVTVPALPDGTYTVAWKTVSAVDGHVVAGTFAFSVGKPTPGGGASGNFGIDVGGPPRWLSVVSRWLSYASFFVLLGAAVFPYVILGPALRRAGVAAVSNGAGRFVLVVALLAVVAGTVMALLMQAWASGGGAASVVNSELRTLTTTTRFGAIWWARAGLTLLALLSGAACLRAQRARLGVAEAALLFTAVCLPLTMSLNSHGAADAHYSKVATGFDWLHVVAGGIWVGGLVQLVAVVPATMRPLDATGRLRLLSEVIPRFSATAIICVTAIVTTGVLQWFVILDSIHDTLHSSYGVTLLVKIGLFTPLLGLGALNLLVMRPAIARQLGQQLHEGGANLASVFRRAVMAEVLFGVAILAATGVLTTGSPPFAKASTGATEGALIQTKDAGNNVDMTLSVDPGYSGRNELDFILKGIPDDKPIEHLLVRFTYLDKALGTTEDEATAIHPTHFQLTGSQLSLTGRWKVETIARRTGMDDVRASFDVNIAASPTPAGPTATLAPLPTLTGQRIDISARNSQSFDPTRVNARAGTISIVFTNDEQNVPHNVHFFAGSGRDQRDIGQTNIERGPDREVLTLTLPVGTYRYICDVHPTMQGTLTLQ